MCVRSLIAKALASGVLIAPVGLAATTAFGQDEALPGPAPTSTQDPPPATNAPEREATPAPSGPAPQAPQAPPDASAGAAAPSASAMPAALAAGAPAGPGPDVIYLADGRVLRGTVVEVLPGESVRLRLATGEIAALPRAAIMRFEHVAPAPEPAPPYPGPLPLDAQGGATSWVHIEGSEAAILQFARRGADPNTDESWIAVCSAPCNQPLPTAGTYRFVGPGLKASRPFTLTARSGEYETLRVHGASKGLFIGGIVTLAAGPPIAIFVSLSVVLANDLDGSGAITGSGRTVAAVSLGAAAALAVLGVGLIVSNLSTDASQNPFSPRPPAPNDGARLPTWRETPVEAALPPTVGLPLYGARF